MFSTTLAAAGTGKLPVDILTVSERPGMDGPVDGATVVTDVPDALVLEADAPDEDVPDAGVLVPAELAVGVPEEHAAKDRPAAQAARASTAERYVFIAFLQSVHNSQVPTLDARPVSQGRFAPSAARRPWQAIRCAAVSPPSVQITYLDAC
jgi:hypothetical protein